MNMFEDFKLRVFETVARTGGFTAAAYELGISQPAVSQNISDLEKTIGEPLFVRNRGEVTLTDKGILFMVYVKKILFWYRKCNAVMIEKTEAPEKPTLLNLDGDRQAEISVEDGSVKIKII